MKTPEDFEDLLRSDLRRERRILLGEIVILIAVTAALAWYFFHVYLTP